MKGVQHQAISEKDQPEKMHSLVIENKGLLTVEDGAMVEGYRRAILTTTTGVIKHEGN